MSKKKATEKAEEKVKQEAEEKRKKKAEKETEELVRELERKLRLPEKFALNILKEGDDWSFVIKLHSFLEAALTQLIIKALGKEELEDMIGELEMIKKIEYTKSLSLLSKEARRFIYMLSKIRNFFVHNIESISLNLLKYIKDLNSDQLRNFIKAMRFAIKETLEINGDKVERDDFIKDVPRITVWICAYTVIQEISAEVGLQISKRDLEKWKLRTTETFFPYKKTDS